MATHVKINNSIFNSSPVVVGEGNQVAVSSNNELNWEYIQVELENVCRKISNNTIEHVVTKEAIDCTKRKDKDGLKNILKKYSVWFCSDVFKGIVSSGIVEIIKLLIST